MARTYRNRRTVPHGWVVRDDGVAYCATCCPTKKIQRNKNHWKPGDILPRSLFYRTHPYCDCYWGPRRFRSRVYAKERKAERKEHYKSYRAKVKDRMRHEDWEGIPRFRRTSGWLTW